MDKHNHYTNVVTDTLWLELLMWLDQNPMATLAFDLETSGLDPREPGASIVSLSLTEPTSEQTWVVPLDHPEGPWGYRWKRMVETLARRLLRFKLVAHNGPFDVGWMSYHSGVDLSDALWWDTQTAAHLLNENQSKKLKSLAANLIPVAWGIDVRHAKGVPWFELAPYNAWDTIATARLYLQQLDYLHETDNQALSHLHNTIVSPAQAILTRMTARGIRLDQEGARAALEAAEASAKEAGQALHSFATDGLAMDLSTYPTYSWGGTSKMFKAVMSQACLMGHIYVVERTDKGSPSWRKGVLEGLSYEGNELARLILQYRDGTKRSQDIRTWLDAARGTGRIHANFNNSRTVTGRLSSSSPNMQQVNRKLKHLMVPSEGKLFCEADWSQVEMRVTAELIHHSVHKFNPMMQAFLDGDVDLHNMAATLAVGGRPQDVSKEDRQKGKAINFGFIFGMGAKMFVQVAREDYGVDFTLSEANRIRLDYFSLWDGLAEWHEYQRQLVAEQGFVENLYGRRRRLPAIFVGDAFERAEAERQAINSPVQGTASDLMMQALTDIELLDGVLGVGTVHDSALLELDSVRKGEDVACAMLRAGVQFLTPLEVEVSIGPKWSTYTEVFTMSTQDLN